MLQLPQLICIGAGIIAVGLVAIFVYCAMVAGAWADDAAEANDHEIR